MFHTFYIIQTFFLQVVIFRDLSNYLCLYLYILPTALLLIPQKSLSPLTIKFGIIKGSLDVSLC